MSASQIEDNEKRARLSALSYLGAVSGPYASHYTYEDIARHEADYDLICIGPLDGILRFIPSRTDPHIVQSAIRRLRNTEPHSAAVNAALYQLWLCTKHERLNDEDRDAQLTTYVRYLSDYPEPHVLHVLGRLTETCKFFPSWWEIRAQLMLFSSWRYGLIAQLERANTRLMQKKEKSS